MLVVYIPSEQIVTGVLKVMVRNMNVRGQQRGYTEVAEESPEQDTKDISDLSFAELKEAAQQGDYRVIPALRGMLKKQPELWAGEPSLVRRGQAMLIHSTAGKNLFLNQQYLHEMAEMKKKLLAETNGSLVEEMIVDQVIYTWFQTHGCRIQEVSRQSDNIQIKEFLSRQAQAAMQSQLKSLEALVKVKLITAGRNLLDSLARPETDSPSHDKNL